MSVQDDQVFNVIGVDLVEKGVLVYFSDGKASLFTREFLSAHRDGDGNTLIADSGPAANATVEDGA